MTTSTEIAQVPAYCSYCGSSGLTNFIRDSSDGVLSFRCRQCSHEHYPGLVHTSSLPTRRWMR